MQIIDGKATAAAIRAEIATSVARIVADGGVRHTSPPYSSDTTAAANLT